VGYETAPPHFDPDLMVEWGVTHRRVAVASASVWEFQLAPGHVEEHSHSAAFFNVVTSGAVENQYGRRQLSLPTERVVFHPEACVHASTVAPGGARLLTLEVEPRWLAGLGIRRNLPKTPEVLATDAFVSRRLRRELRHQDDATQLVVEGLLLQLIAQASRYRPVDAPRLGVERAVELLHEEIAEKWTLEAVAARVELAPERLASAFRKRYGCGLGEYLRGLRVEHVRRGLHGDTPLAELALEAGFADQAHCTRVFKRFEGVPPGVYRARLRGERADSSAS
jgi:AraC family transcriptional regulator